MRCAKCGFVFKDNDYVGVKSQTKDVVIFIKAREANGRKMYCTAASSKPNDCYRNLFTTKGRQR